MNSLPHMLDEETPPKGMRLAGSDSRTQVMEPVHAAPAGVPPSWWASADGEDTPSNSDTTGALRPSAAARRNRSGRPTRPPANITTPRRNSAPPAVVGQQPRGM